MIFYDLGASNFLGFFGNVGVMKWVGRNEEEDWGCGCLHHVWVPLLAGWFFFLIMISLNSVWAFRYRGIIVNQFKWKLGGRLRDPSPKISQFNI